MSIFWGVGSIKTINRIFDNTNAKKNFFVGVVYVGAGGGVGASFEQNPP